MCSQMRSTTTAAPIEEVTVNCYRIPTDLPESDGTLEWNSTTLVLLQIRAGGRVGIGYGYADIATARLLHTAMIPILEHRDGLATSARVHDCVAGVRNLGRAGICAMAVSIIDTALWDLKAKLLDTPLVTLLGAARDTVTIYGSGGFTSYSDAQLQQQLSGYAMQGMRAVKMKVGREPQRDEARVRAARAAIGPQVHLFVDANGAYTRKEAVAQAQAFAAADVRWFEEPVSSDDLEGLHLLRDRGPAGMAIAAGEYGYDLPYFRHMLAADAVDVLQADATRCGGISGFLGAAALCDAHCMPLSAHCAPALHAALCCACQVCIHLEYFHDHARIESLLFDGVPQPNDGALRAQTDRPGLGLIFKTRDAQCFSIT